MLNCLFENCNLEFNNYLKFVQHIRRKHNITIKEYYNKYSKKENEGICLNCQKETKFLRVNKGYNKYCSCKCSANSDKTKEKRIKTNIEKYGCENVFQDKEIKEKIEETNTKRYGTNNPFQSEEIKEKIKKTNLLKYGCENPNQNKDVREKIKETNLKKYGVESPIQNEEIKEKTKKTNLKKYGCENPNQNKEVQEKTKKTNLQKYGVENPFQSEEIKEKIKEINLEKFNNKLYKLLKYLNLELLDNKYIGSKINHNWKCTICNNEFIQKWDYINQGYKCSKCNHRNYKYSKKEKELTEFIKLLNIEVIENCNFILNKKELDIFIPSKNIAIEFDGLYWHSEEQGKDKFYHLNKTEECLKNNIQLIHIFEDEWVFKQDIVKSRLRQILNLNNSQKIHARKCIIKEISPKLKNEFLNKYHIQGEDKSLIKLGSFYNDKLISVMTFSHGSISRKKLNESDWELSRFCSNSDYHIPGMSSKLLSYFKRNYNWKEIYSYADRRWSQGNLYFKIGFELDSVTKPNYFYIKNGNRIHRFNLRKRSDEPKDIPEWVLRSKEGYIRIWDCGHYKFKISR